MKPRRSGYRGLNIIQPDGVAVECLLCKDSAMPGLPPGLES
jgi:hypothetical protein